MKPAGRARTRGGDRSEAHGDLARDDPSRLGGAGAAPHNFPGSDPPRGAEEEGAAVGMGVLPLPHSRERSRAPRGSPAAGRRGTNGKRYGRKRSSGWDINQAEYMGSR